MTDAATESASEDEDQKTAERSAQAMRSRDRVTPALGMVLERIAKGSAKMSMVVREDMLNGHDTCHGGYLFMLADSTFAYACNSRNKVSFAASADISYLKPAQLGETLTATAREVYQEGRNGIYDVEVRNAEGEMVAHFMGKSRTVRGEVTDPPGAKGGEQ